jgi:hypothetical protein
MREQWELKVIEMLQEEPDVTADERKQIVDYLTSVFKPGGRIYINLAGTKDLAKLLDIPLDEAERITAQRRTRDVHDRRRGEECGRRSRPRRSTPRRAS